MDQAWILLIFVSLVPGESGKLGIHRERALSGMLVGRQGSLPSLGCQIIVDDYFLQLTSFLTVGCVAQGAGFGVTKSSWQQTVPGFMELDVARQSFGGQAAAVLQALRFGWDLSSCMLLLSCWSLQGHHKAVNWYWDVDPRYLVDAIREVGLEF